MKKRLYGALPQQDITHLIQEGFVTGVHAGSENIQPASLDLTLTDRVYELDGVALPARNEHMRHFREALGARETSFDKPLEVGKAYLALLAEGFNLSDSIYGYVNPKSSTGRVDVHARLLSDECESFDSVRTGYRGPVWVHIVPKSFRTKLAPGMCLNQMRFFSGDTRFTQTDLEAEHADNPLVWDMKMGYPVQLDRVSAPNRNGTVVLHADLSSDVVGWRAKKTKEILDLSQRNIDPTVFWAPARPENGKLLLKKGQFWILSTKEGVVVPPWLSAEVVAMDERFMEGRTHYAGFFDPGWGWRPGSPMGDTATMEVRTSEDVYLRDGQLFVAFRFERMTCVPDVLYGAGSHYTGQLGAKLAKFFAPFPAGA